MITFKNSGLISWILLETQSLIKSPLILKLFNLKIRLRPGLIISVNNIKLKMSHHIYMPFMPTFLKFLNYTKTLLIIPSKELKSTMTGHPRKRKKSTMTRHPRTKYLEVFVNKPFRWARLPFCSFRHFEMDTTAHVN